MADYPYSYYDNGTDQPAQSQIQAAIDAGLLPAQQTAYAPQQGTTAPTGGTDPWAAIAAAYGLGAPPAQGLPATMSAPDFGPAPQMSPALMDMNSIPQPQAQTMGISDQIRAMSGGQGYSPDVIARMKANAMETAASAGAQTMGQTKRILGQSGIRGGAAAAVQGDVARQVGQTQGRAMNDIDISNAQVGNENAKFGIGQETSIGANNMQATNAMAVANANRMTSALQQNNQNQNGANTMNTQMTFQRQNDQSNMNYQNQKSQWDELNKRYGQTQNILGAWGQAA